MKSVSIILLATVCYCNGMTVPEEGTAPIMVRKERQFPSIPLPWIQVPSAQSGGSASQGVVPAAAAPVATSGTCPGRCCKTYCLGGDFCTAGIGPAPPTCNPSTITPKKCLNTAGTGCSSCTPSNSCQNECGAVMNISPIVICPK